MFYFHVASLATQACGKEMIGYKSMTLDGTLVVANGGSIILSNQAVVYINGYYALYNSTFECSYCTFICEDDSWQFFYVFGTDIDTTSCQNNNQTTNDTITMELIDKISQISTLIITSSSIDNTNDNECENNDSKVYDIGYPFEVDNDIINVIEEGYICCRGYRSCFGASSVISNLGNILCLAFEACKETVVWNTNADQSVSSTNNNTTSGMTLTSTANVFCIAESACGDSTIRSQDGIYCLAPNSCENGVILDGFELYCTKYSCTNSKVTNIEFINLFDSQSGMIIFSNGIGNMTVSLRGIDAGYDVTIYCSENDYCVIDCGTQNACNNLDLYCSGKCKILCDDEEGITCPNIILSMNPTDAPSMAPTHAPSIFPTAVPSEAPTCKYLLIDLSRLRNLVCDSSKKKKKKRGCFFCFFL